MGRDTFPQILRDIIARAVVTAVDDSTGMQTLQIQLHEDELADLAEHFQPYGFTSVPQTGAEATVVFVGADRSHPVVVVTDDRRVRKAGLKAGEVAVYHKDGDYVHLKNGHEIEIKTKKFNVQCDTATVTASQEVTFDTPLTTFTGVQRTTGRRGTGGSSSFVGGLKNTGGKVESNGITLENHVHSGVQSGGSTTGGPQ